MWVRVILSSLPLCVWRKQSSGVQSALVLNSTPPTTTLSDRKAWLLFCCSSVCGLWSTPLGKRSALTLFHAAPRFTSSAHNICLGVGRGLGRALSQPGPLFIHQLCLRLCGCVRSWGSSPLPHPSLPKHPPTVCLLTWPRVVLGPGPRAPVCVWHSPLLTPWWCVIGGICACLCLPGPLDAGGNRMREDQL